MRLAYILFSDYENHKSKGVMKKIDGQIHAFQKLGYDVDLFYMHEGMAVLRTQTECERKRITMGISKNRGGEVAFIVEHLKDRKYDLSITRFPGCIDLAILRLFKTLKKNDCKTVLELPTYPISGEMKRRLIEYWKEHQIFRLIRLCCAYTLHWFITTFEIRKSVDRILSYYEQETIWGINVVNVDNGIEYENIPIANRNQKKDTNEITMCQVAAFADWHGVDRVVCGLDNYYKNKTEEDPDIKLYLVGEGKALQTVLMTDAYRRTCNHVKLTGQLIGDDLDEIFNMTDVAFSSLGMHRIGMKQGSTLKTKEYCARGVPFVYAYFEKQIPDSFDYAFRIDGNENPVNMNQILDFYNDLCIKHPNYNLEMRKFAKIYDWESQLSMFIKEIE